jgi:hypothetical protein
VLRQKKKSNKIVSPNYTPPTGWELFSTLKTEATSSPETLITIVVGKICDNPENHNLTIHSRGIQPENSFP